VAEVLVLVEDRSTGDPHIDAVSWQRGDVITVQEDGFAWSHDERTRPGFAVIPVPGISVATLMPLTVPDPYTIPIPGDEENHILNPTWRRARNRLDLVVLSRLLNDPAAWIALLEDGGQAAAFAAGLIVATPERPAPL
jgi:hypothetical protein